MIETIGVGRILMPIVGSEVELKARLKVSNKVPVDCPLFSRLSMKLLPITMRAINILIFVSAE